MNELIKINENQISDETVDTVNARELHLFLESKQDFSTWIKKRIKDYGFLENQDYILLHKKMEQEENSHGGSNKVEYYISLDMAKELAMVERNDKGREARKYFIECEKKQAKALKAISTVSLDLSSNLVVYKDDDFYLSSLSIQQD